MDLPTQQTNSKVQQTYPCICRPSFPPTHPASLRPPALVAKELRLRLAQCEDSLSALRKHLRVASLVFDFQSEHTAGTGQKANTRVRAVQHRYVNLGKFDAARYRVAREVLANLDPGGSWRLRFQELSEGDCRYVGKVRGSSEGHRELSWIWLNPAPGESNPQ